jgi:uncharacterized protein
LDLVTPDAIVPRVRDISVGVLEEWSIAGIALDLDNTIVPWHSTQLAAGVAEWVESIQARGIRMCLLSNNYMPHVRRVGARLGLPVVQGRLKPLPAAYGAALELLGTEPRRSLAIGDQLFTDVLGAKIVGMRAIVVAPLGTREFPTTRVLRLFERAIYARLSQSETATRLPS